MFFLKFWRILKDAAYGFDQHNVLRLSASLGFYTIFSIGPMMLVIIFISNIFWGRQAIEGTIYNQISGLIGDTAALQVQELIKNASISSSNFMAFIGIVSLVIAATSVFTDMQESMNTIWNLKVKTGRGWQQMFKNRLLSFCIIAGLGILLLLFLIINGILEGFTSKLTNSFPHISISVVYGVNLLITLFVVTLLFAFIYKVLPDATIRWRDVWEGALFAAVLFMIGKFAVTFYINHSNLNNTYSSAGSMIVLMLWIYYSAIILYFGAEFTKAYALKREIEIKPKEYAVTTEAVLSETNEPTVQKNENLIS
jgi:membrane protein